MYITIVEINSELIKIVQAQSNSKDFFINKALVFPVVGLSQEACASSLGKLISQNNIKIDKLIALVSRRDITVRILKFPSAEKTELQQMVSFEAMKQIPFPPEDIFFDYRVMELTSDGFSEVVLSIAHKNVVNKIIDILNKNSIKPEILTVTTEGLYLWAKTVLSHQIQKDKAILVMDIDRNNIEMEIISGNKILLSRTFSLGAASLSDAAVDYQANRERLYLEVKRSIDIYNKEQNQNLPVERIVITGSLIAAEAIVNIFKERLAIDAVAIESTKGLPVDAKAFNRNDMIKDVSLASPLGALFALNTTCLNILPPQFKKRQNIAQKSKKIIILGILAACLFTMLSLGFAAKFFQKKIWLNNIKTSIKKIKPFTKELELKSKMTELMRSHIEASKRPLTFLYELHRVIPQGVLLNYLSFDNKRKIILQGTTPSMPNVFNFVNKLEKSEKFKNVQTVYVSKRRLKEKETVDFQITCELSI